MKICKNKLHSYPAEHMFCQKCRDISNKKWAGQNKEQKFNNYKKHYNEKKEQINQRSREYHLANKDSIKRQQKTYNKLNKPHLTLKSKEWFLKKRYNLTLDELNLMYKEQNHVCAICEKSELDLTKKLHIDHCHASGKVRGLLCGSCNRAIGLLQDSSDMCLKAGQYLLNHKKRES